MPITTVAKPPDAIFSMGSTKFLHESFLTVPYKCDLIVLSMYGRCAINFQKINRKIK